MFEKLCPTCGKPIIYKSMEIRDQSIANNFNCKSCSAKIRFMNKENHPHFGKHRSEETKEKIREASKKQFENGMPQETIDKISKSKFGKYKGIDAPMYGKVHTEESKKKMSISQTGKHFHTCSEETKHKISISQLGTTFSDEHKKNLSISHIGNVPSDETRKKLRLASIAHAEKYNVKFPNFNPKACEIIEQYGKEHGYNFQHALNGGEYHIKELGYFVDGYDKEKNVVIEYYEKHHKRKEECDKKRKLEITNFLNCEFIEILE